MDEELLAHDEPRLAGELASLSHRAAAAFATACAGRLAASLEPGAAEAEIMMLALNLLRAFAAAGEMNDPKAIEARLLAAMPADDPSLAAALTEDALAAAAYALRYVADGEVQNAVWAARRAYDAVDRFAAESVSGVAFTEELEAAILQHPEVQMKLRRQKRDLDQLRDAGADPAYLVRVVERGACEPILV